MYQKICDIKVPEFAVQLFKKDKALISLSKSKEKEDKV